MKRRFASRAEAVPAVIEDVRSLCRGAGFAPQQAFEIATCTAEAINNAIEHAYAGSPDGVVTVSCTVRDGVLVVEVADRGARMRGAIPVHPAPADGEAGRGWGIMRAWSDRLRYLHRGACNVVRLERTLPETPDSP